MATKFTSFTPLEEADSKPAPKFTSFTPIEAQEEAGPTGLSALYPAIMRGGRGLASLATDVLPAMAAHAVGKDEYAKKKMEEAAAYGKETEELYPAAVGSYKNIHGLGDFGTYAVEAVGEAIPTLLPSLFTGGVASVAGRGAVAAAKMAAEKAVTQAAKGATEAEIKAAAMKAGIDAANKVALKHQAVGAVAGSAAQNIPDVYQNIYDKTGKQDLGAALVAGGFNAALDAITPINLMRKAKMGGIKPEEIAAAWYKRLAKGTVEGAAIEGGTEGLQEASSIAAENFVDKNPDFFNKKNFERVMDATLKGGLGGGVITGVTDTAFGKGPEKKAPAPKGFTSFTPVTPAATTPALNAKQQARQDAVTQRAQVLEQQHGITSEDAARIAEDDIAAEEEKIKGLTTKAPDTRVKARAVELIDSGMSPDDAYTLALQQIQEELENDAQNKEEGALDVTGTKPKPNRKSAGVVNQPIARAPAAGPQTTERAGVVPTEENVGAPNVGEEQQSPAVVAESQAPAPAVVAESQAPAPAQDQTTASLQFTTFTPIEDQTQTETQEGAPASVATPIETKQTKPKKQKAAAATTVTPEVPKVDVAAASAATDPAEIQQHLDAIEAEGATLLSKDGRFPKKGTAKRTRLEEIGAVKRELTAKLQAINAPTEAPVVETTQPQGEVSTQLDKYEGLHGATRVGAIRGDIANNNKVLKLADKRGETELVAQLTQENERLNALLPEAETRDNNDRAANIDRQILGQAKSELDTAIANGEISQETAEQLVDEARETGNVADAAEHILSGVDKTETPAIESKTEEAKEPESWYSFVDAAREQAERELEYERELDRRQELSNNDVWQYPEGYTPQPFPYTGKGTPTFNLQAEVDAEAAELARTKREYAAEKRGSGKKATAKERAEENRKLKEEKQRLKEENKAEDEAAKAAEAEAARALKEEQDKADAAERAANAKAIELEKQIVGALKEVIGSPRFPVGIKKDAQRHLDTITESANATDADAHDAGVEMAFNFLTRLASTPRFTRVPKKSLPSIGKAKVQSIVDLIKARWKNAPTVVVADNIDDAAVPAALKKADDEAKARGDSGVAAGVFYGGKVYIFADQMKSAAETVKTLLHEALGHYGLRGTFGEKLTPILDMVLKQHKDKVLEVADKYKLDLSKEKDAYEAAEEVLANLAQTKPTMGIVQRAVAAVRNFVRALGFNVKMSNDDLIANYILPARAFVEDGRLNSLVGGVPAFSRNEEETLPPEEKKTYTNTVRTEKEVDEAVNKAKFKFSESAKAQEAAKGVSALQMATNPSKSIPAMRAIWKRATAVQRKLLVKLVPTSFLVNWAGNAIPELSKTNKLLQQMGGMTEQLLHAAGELTNEVERAFRADENLRGKLDKLTSIATLAEVDPSLIDTAERSEELDKAWKDLGPDGQKLYTRIRDHFAVLSKYLSKLLDDQVDNLNISDEDKKNLMKKIRATFEKGSRINPYFPLVREGDFWWSMGSGKNRVFYMAETAAERDNVAREFAAEKLKRGANESEAAFNKRIDDKLAELTEDGEFETGDNIGELRKKPYAHGEGKLLTETFKAIDAIDFGDPQASESLKDSIYQAFLETMPDQSFRQQFIHRKGTAGFRVDVLRNTAHTSARMATQLARVKYSPLLRNSLMSAKASIRGRPALDPFVSEMSARVDSELAPKAKSATTTIAGALNKASFIYYLGGASSALLQPLSIFQTGMPVLAQYGTFKATREMARMLKVWSQLGMYKTNLDGSKSWVAPSILYAKDTTAVERKAYRAAAELGLFSSTQAASVFEHKATPTEKIRSPQMKFATGAVDNLILGGLMNSSERLSREAVFLTSFRLNMEKHGNFDRAVSRATYDTNEALGNFAQSERPVFMKSSFGKILTQFQMYPLHVATFLINNFKEMIKPMDGRTRGEAAHKFFGTLGSTFVLAGAAGLPGFSTVMGLIGAAWNQLKDDDWPEDMKSMDFEAWWTTTGLAEWLGPAKIGGVPLSDVLVHGLANALTGLDIAGRTTLNNLFTRDSKEYKTVRDSLTAKMLDHAGPSANMILSIADGVDAATQGDYAKAVKKWSPAGFRNFINAHELATEGAKDSKGNEILTKDAFSTGMLIGQSIGFRPEVLANTQYATFKALGWQQKMMNEHNLIIDKLDRYNREGNEKAFDAMAEDIDRFNAKYPQSAILPDEIANSLEKREEQRGMSDRGFTPTERNMPMESVLRRSREAAEEAERKGKRP